MVASTSFLAFGLLGGFAYLAYTKKRELLCYGLASVGVGFFLEGIRMMTKEGSGFATFLDILHHVAFGVGGAFLAYVGAIEGWKYSRVWKERRHEAELAFQAKLRAKKNEPRPDADVAAAPDDAIKTRPTTGKRAGA